MRRSVFKIRPTCTFLYKLLSAYIFQPRLNAAHFFKILHSGLGNYEAGVSVQALYKEKERKSIFLDPYQIQQNFGNDGRVDFLRRLGRLLSETQTVCFPVHAKECETHSTKRIYAGGIQWDSTKSMSCIIDTH